MERYSVIIPDQTENSLVVSTLVDQLKMEINNVNSIIDSMNKLPAMKADYLERVQQLIDGLAVMSVNVQLLDEPPPEPIVEPVVAEAVVEPVVVEEPISELAPIEPDPIIDPIIAEPIVEVVEEVQ